MQVLFYAFMFLPQVFWEYLFNCCIFLSLPVFLFFFLSLFFSFSFYVLAVDILSANKIKLFFFYRCLVTLENFCFLFCLLGAGRDVVWHHVSIEKNVFHQSFTRCMPVYVSVERAECVVQFFFMCVFNIFIICSIDVVHLNVFTTHRLCGVRE